jgi:hypothetical protein
MRKARHQLFRRIKRVQRLAVLKLLRTASPAFEYPLYWEEPEVLWLHINQDLKATMMPLL